MESLDNVLFRLMTEKADLERELNFLFDKSNKKQSKLIANTIKKIVIVNQSIAYLQEFIGEKGSVNA